MKNVPARRRVAAESDLRGRSSQINPTEEDEASDQPELVSNLKPEEGKAIKVSLNEGVGRSEKRKD